jgi:hypothetical protein
MSLRRIKRLSKSCKGTMIKLKQICLVPALSLLINKESINRNARSWESKSRLLITFRVRALH